MVPGYDVPNSKVVRETDKALCISAPYFGLEIGQFWVPKSQVTVDSQVNHLWDKGELCVTEWFAMKRGWL